MAAFQEHSYSWHGTSSTVSLDRPEALRPAHLAGPDDGVQAAQLLLERHVIGPLQVGVVRPRPKQRYVPVRPVDLASTARPEVRRALVRVAKFPVCDEDHVMAAHPLERACSQAQICFQGEHLTWQTDQRRDDKVEVRSV